MITHDKGPPYACRDTILVGLIGQGIGPSRTPPMHEAEAARLGFPLCYRRLDIDRMPRDATIGEIVDAAELMGFAGVNVTHPFKIAVIDTLTELSEAAQATGAVNTIVFDGGKRRGHNTDQWGFRENLTQTLPDAARGRVLLIGAGGAGSAVAHALADFGVETLLIADSDAERARGLAARLDRTRPSLKVELTRAATDARRLDGIVNATPTGMTGHPGLPYPADRLTPALWVADIVYFPLETEFLAAARAAGCAVLPGAGMAILQAVRAFELFTGTPPDPTAMRATFDALGQD